MKRQSKPEKIKKEKSTAPGEWLYFAPANVTVRSIYEVLTCFRGTWAVILGL